MPMDRTVWLGPLKFSLRATIDHHGPSIHVHSSHYTAFINCCKKNSIATITQLRSLELLIAKTPLLHMYTIWIDWHMIFGLEQEGESLIAPMALAHPLHPIDKRSRNRRRNLWVGWCFPPDDLCSRLEALCQYICIHMHSLYEFCYRTYIYTYNRSVIQYWWSCTPPHSIGLYFWGVRGSWVECHFLFSLFYQKCLALW